MIKEIINDGSRFNSDGKLTGSVIYEFHSPTHWSAPCNITVTYNPYREHEICLNYGSGGCNKGFTQIEIAEVMSEVFARAADRMKKLELQIKGDSK